MLPRKRSRVLTYDALDRLAKVQSGSAITRFVYDGNEIAGEHDNGTNILRRYVKGAGVDETIVWYEGATLTNRKWLLADERGSVIGITNANGSARPVDGGASYTYDEYGRPSSPATGSRFRYTGQALLHELGLYYYKARVYNPSLGRFMQPDPIGYGGGMNMYAYVGGDPVNLSDPSGLGAEDPDQMDFAWVTGQYGINNGWTLAPGVSSALGVPFTLPPVVATYEYTGGEDTTITHRRRTDNRLVMVGGREIGNLGPRFPDMLLSASTRLIFEELLNTSLNIAAPVPSGRFGQHVEIKMPGNYGNALKVFNKMLGSNKISPIIKNNQTVGYHGSVDNLNINVRNYSTEGSPTLEIYHNVNTWKFRFGGP